MGLDKPYLDVPGTTVFDWRPSPRGYDLNQFCMSLMAATTETAFALTSGRISIEWPMTEQQKQGVLDRDFNRLISLGGNIYFLAKIGATDGWSFQKIAELHDRHVRGRTTGT